MEKIYKYVEEVKAEWQKVEWPTRKELVDSTIVVFAVVAFFTLVVFLIDLLINQLLMLFV